MILFVEIRLPTFITSYAGFLATFLGRGMWYLFLGCLILVPPENMPPIQVFFFVAAIFCIVVGFIFILLQFIAAVDRPRPVYVQQPNPA